MAGIYIHIPFCKSFCTYCGFYSVKDRGREDKFIAALQKEIFYKKDFFKHAGVSPETLYIGGGTPSVLPAGGLARVVGAVKEGFGLVDIPEFTVEVNPNDITPEYVRSLAALGVNRVSMGIQSFIDRHLKWMNRRHTAAQGEQAYRILRENGIRNISIDLIFGYEGLSPEDWEYNLDRALSLAPEHISAYQMSIEPGSVLFSMVRRGEYRPLAEEVCRMQYCRLQDRLTEAGYEQYEISNFAKVIPGEGTPSGWRSRHNSSYWDKSPYLGLGPSAHSYDGRKRSWNGNSLKRYCEYYMNRDMNADADADESYTGGETLSRAASFNESLMLGLRRKEGVWLEELDRLLLNAALPDIKRMHAAGNLIVYREGGTEQIGADCMERAVKSGELSGYKMIIPSAKWFVSDGIIRELFILS